ncbi:glucose-induced degradation protein 8-A homolog [Octopus bimaculoides]|uniref:glucose-induced degradation protein 8-A homolog n=1 Tax=Octopus bimaculoides TaxID=37653 RepID=UPI00071CE8DF|nr:glucose-induced degradation protein 8-A homolog [Octopus bimaculoides]|eukprot:XP_014767645.1 PREDICTED: glucose-induced degradation protein 8 homolog [Octopus bimaculoides]
MASSVIDFAAMLLSSTYSSKESVNKMSLGNDKQMETTKEEWMEKLNNLHITRADMNRLIMNYLVTEGFKEAAEKFRVESGIQPSVDLDQLDERIKIRDAIQNGRIQEAISLVNSLHPELLDNDRYLYFHLQVTPTTNAFVASELNAAILDVDSTPKLANLLKLLLWAQEELDKKKVKYPKLVDLAKGEIDFPK